MLHMNNARASRTHVSRVDFSQKHFLQIELTVKSTVVDHGAMGERVAGCQGEHQPGNQQEGR